MRVPPVSATRQSFAGELTAPVGRNRRPPISAGCRRASLLCGLRCAPAEKVPHSCIHAEKENLCCLPVGQGCRLRKRDPACGFAERWRAVRVPVAVGLRCAPAKMSCAGAFCLPFCPLPGVAACKPVVFFAARVALVRRRRLARRGGAGYVSAPHREGRRISRLCSPERSWPLPVLILPRKLRLVFRPLFAAAEKLARPASERLRACGGGGLKGIKKGRKDWLSGPV